MLWLAPTYSLVLYILLISYQVNHEISATIAVTVLTVSWWVSESVAIPIASIVPFALLPLTGVIDHKTAASALGSHVILLLMGAFMLSKALEKSGAHVRLAHTMLHIVGANSKKRLVFAFMITTALLSMWISNTATALIMLPIALAMIKNIEEQALKVALILGIAYSASVGGLGTLIGTPPNVIFAGIYQEQVGKEFDFLDWMKIGIPVVLISIPVMALWLTRSLHGKIETHLPSVGKWQVEETRTLLVFALTILVWITRKAPFGGWSDLLNIDVAGDSTVALAAVVVMCLLPNGRKGKILDWKHASEIPWGMLLLFAGGIVLAKGFLASGLSDLIGDGLSGFTRFPLVITILLLCLSVTYITEITSNTATATLLMPILYVVAINQGAPPELLMIPAAMAASCAFMLPVATAPNAIAYGTGLITISSMVKEGAVLSFVISSLLGCVVYFVLA